MLSGLLVATTQRRTTALVDHVLKLNREHRDKGIVIKIDFWDEIEDFFMNPEISIYSMTIWVFLK